MLNKKKKKKKKHLLQQLIIVNHGNNETIYPVGLALATGANQSDK